MNSWIFILFLKVIGIGENVIGILVTFSIRSCNFETQIIRYK